MSYPAPTPTVPSPRSMPSIAFPSVPGLTVRRSGSELNVTPIPGRPGYFKETNYGFVVNQLPDNTVVVTGICYADGNERELTKVEREIATSIGLVVMAKSPKKEPKEEEEPEEAIKIFDYSKPNEQHTLFSDISLTTSEGIKLHYHRCMLLEYKYFERMLTGYFKESKREHNDTDLPYDFDLSNLILNMLNLEFRCKEYKSLITEENIYEIYSAADMLFLDNIRDQCKSKIIHFNFSNEWYDFVRLHSIDISDAKLIEKYLRLKHEERESIDKTKLDINFWCAYIRRSPQNFNYIWNHCLVYVNPEDFEQAVSHLTKDMFDKESREILANLLKTGNETAKTIIDHYLKL